MSSSDGSSPTSRRPRGRAPTGKVWNYAKAAWVDEATAPSGECQKPSYNPRHRPRGRPPFGKTWDAATLSWVDEIGRESTKRRKSSSLDFETASGGGKLAQEQEEEAEDSRSVTSSSASSAPRGRPPKGAARYDMEQGAFVDEEGRVVESKAKSKGPSTKPRGRPPKDKVWDEKKLCWVSAKTNA